MNQEWYLVQIFINLIVSYIEYLKEIISMHFYVQYYDLNCT